jgi:hypothetical protein
MEKEIIALMRETVPIVVERGLYAQILYLEVSVKLAVVLIMETVMVARHITASAHVHINVGSAVMKLEGYCMAPSQKCAVIKYLTILKTAC